MTLPPAQRALITGASGFLGSYAVREFADHGWHVVANGRNVQALSRVRNDSELLVGDLASLATTSLPVDVVVHSAALSSIWGERDEFIRSNVEGTRAVIEFARRNGARRIVFVSSPSVYTRRRDMLNIDESQVHERNTLNWYIRTKIAAERMLRAALLAGEISELTIIRPRGLVGVGDPSLMPRLITAHETRGIPLFRGGRNLVDVTCVENAALALRLAAQADTTGTYNITNGEPREFGSIVREFFDARGEQPRFFAANRTLIYPISAALEAAFAVRPGRPEPPVTRYTIATLAYSQTLDISQARRDLGYAPVMSLTDGLRNAAAA